MLVSRGQGTAMADQLLIQRSLRPGAGLPRSGRGQARLLLRPLSLGSPQAALLLHRAPRVWLNRVFQGYPPGRIQTPSHEPRLQAQWRPECWAWAATRGRGGTTQPPSLRAQPLSSSVACVGPPPQLLPESPSMGLGPGPQSPFGSHPGTPHWPPAAGGLPCQPGSAPLPPRGFRCPTIRGLVRRLRFRLHCERVYLQRPCPEFPPRTWRRFTRRATRSTGNTSERRQLGHQTFMYVFKI